MELIIELTPGDVFLFPDSLILHRNEVVKGERSSIIAFTQENLFHYWSRKYKYVNNKKRSKCNRYKTFYQGILIGFLPICYLISLKYNNINGIYRATGIRTKFIFSPLGSSYGRVRTFGKFILQLFQ